MRIPPTPSRNSVETPLRDSRTEAPRSTDAKTSTREPLRDVNPLPGQPQFEGPDTSHRTPDPPGRDLDGQIQKARFASMFNPSVQALPIKVLAQIKSLRPPDAGLQQPKASEVTRLNDMLKTALKAAASGTEEGRLAVDKVLKEAVKVYGIGQDGVTGLEFDPKYDDQGGTIGLSGQPRTHIIIGKSGLNSAEEMASTILHESSHVQRNKELADNGIDRSKLGWKAADIYAALIEVEGYTQEINNAKKLGTSPTYVKGAEQLRERYLRQLELAGGKDWRDLAEKGQFKKAHEIFRQEVLKSKP